MAEYDDVMRILMANAQKTFVQRILMPNKFPVLPQPDGSHATHKMAWSEANGKYYVYPTVLYDGKGLKEYDPKTAFSMAMKTGNVIGFDDAKQADWFSKRYKAAWEKK